MWIDIKEQVADERIQYSLVENYPKEEFLQFERVLVEEYGMTEERLQREFGQHLFDELIEVYEQVYFRKGWGALDMIDNIEEQIHCRLRPDEGEDFIPPKLETELREDETIVLRYESDQEFCQIVKGIILSIAHYYDTRLMIDEPLCTKDGDEACRLVVSQVD